MQTHQNNHLRILELRKSSTALDAQIRDTLSSLASTRSDIVTTHTTTFPPGPSYPFAYEELLSYARRISKTSMPPASIIKDTRRAGTQSPVSPDGGGAQTPQPLGGGWGDGGSAGGSQQNTGVVPSAAATPSQPQSPALLNGLVTTPFSFLQQQPTQNTITTLPEVITQYLNPLSGQVFYPWPVEEKIRSGALASNQILSEQGIDPRGYDPAEEEERKQREEEDRKEKEEEERLAREEEARKAREEHERRRREREQDQEKWRASTAAASSPTQPANTGGRSQFRFASMDDDLDDDDDD